MSQKTHPLRNYFPSLLSGFFLLALFLSCAAESQQEPLKILNSFAENETLWQIWPQIFTQFQKTYRENVVAYNVPPRAFLYRLQKLYAANSLPNLLYLNPASSAGKYLSSRSLLHNLYPDLVVKKQRSDILGQIPFSPLALIPQGSESNVLWVLPLTIQLNGILFANEAILRQQGLEVPQNMEELQSTIATLRQRGYRQPLVLGFTFAGNILNNILGTIVGRYIEPEFFLNAILNPELLQTKEFRSALQLYLDYLGEDGILPQEVRRLVHGEGLIFFNNEQAAFLLGNDRDAEHFKINQEDRFRNQIGWYTLPVEQERLSRKYLLSGEVCPGYALTAFQNAEMQRRSIRFLNYMFTEGIQQYAEADSGHQTFSVPIKYPDRQLFYLKKTEFYNRPKTFVDDIRNSMTGEEYKILQENLDLILNGVTDIDHLTNTLYSSAINHPLRRNSSIALKDGTFFHAGY